jgi:hypothetical protein
VKCGGRPYVPDRAIFSLSYSPKLVERLSEKSGWVANWCPAR